MLERVEAVITGIEGAIEKGRALRVQGQDGSRARSSQTGTALARLEALRRRVEQGTWDIGTGLPRLHGDLT